MTLSHQILMLASLADLPDEIYSSARGTWKGLTTEVKGAAGALFLVALLWVLVNGDGENERE